MLHLSHLSKFNCASSTHFSSKLSASSTVFSLYIAYECEPLGFRTNEVVIDDLQNSYIYKERVTTSNKWKECDACCQEQQENIIRENLYFRNQNVEFYYYRPKLLSLGRTFKKNACHTNCRNKYVSVAGGTDEFRKY